VPTFAAVDSVAHVISFIQQYGYPVIVKPRKGYSSIGTTAIRTPEMLATWLATAFKSVSCDASLDLEVERFVNGTMYHIDGLVLNGSVKICWPSRYVNTVMEFATNGYIAGYSLAVKDPLVPRLQSFIHKCFI